MSFGLPRLDEIGGGVTRMLGGGQGIGSAVNSALSQARSTFSGVEHSASSALDQVQHNNLVERGEEALHELTDQGHPGLADAESAITGHMGHLLQTRGFTPEGAEQWVRGQLPTDAIDRLNLGSLGSRVAEGISRFTNVTDSDFHDEY